MMSSGAASNGLRSTRIGYLGTMQDVSSNNQWISYQLPWISSFTRDWDKSIFRIFCLMLMTFMIWLMMLNHFFIFIARTRPFLVWSYPRRPAQASKGNWKEAYPEVPQKPRSLKLLERLDGPCWSTKRDQYTEEKNWCLACETKAYWVQRPCQVKEWS